MKKIIKSFMFTAIIAACMFCLTFNASAATVGDVIAHAYEVGMPEELIQNYISMGSGREWSSEQCDQAIATLDSWYAQRDDAIADGNNTSGDIPDPVKPDDFADMEIEDKKDYISKLPADKKQEYINIMTNEEKNQMLKDLDTTKQVEVISGMLGFGDAFGYSFSIEDVADGSVMLSARDENNNLIGVTVLGDSVEKTGITYTVPITIAVILILLSSVGMVLIVRKCGDKK